jgi:hypothetical protein
MSIFKRRKPVKLTIPIYPIVVNLSEENNILNKLALKMVREAVNQSSSIDLRSTRSKLQMPGRL